MNHTVRWVPSGSLMGSGWVLGGSQVGPRLVSGGSWWAHKDTEILQHVVENRHRPQIRKIKATRGSDFERYSMTFYLAFFVNFHDPARPLKWQQV